ncbi:MAG: hypothetical protein RLZZ312_1112, partial [Bacteroidota bacterium]
LFSDFVIGSTAAMRERLRRYPFLNFCPSTVLRLRSLETSRGQKFKKDIAESATAFEQRHSAQ